MSYRILVPWGRRVALASIAVAFGCASSSSSSSGERTSTKSAAARFEAMAQRTDDAPACVGEPLGIAIEATRDFRIELLGPAVDGLDLENIDALEDGVFDGGTKHALPPAIRAGKPGSMALVLAFVPVGSEDSALDASADSVPPVRVEILAAATHCDPRAGFSLRLGRSVFYAAPDGTDAELRIAGPDSGVVSVHEVGVSESEACVVGPMPLEAAEPLVVPVHIQPAPGPHLLELRFAEDGAPDHAEVVASATFEVRGPRWARIEAMVTRFGTTLDARPHRVVREIGDELELSGYVEAAGHLTLVTVDAADQVSLLVPNRKMTAKPVPAGPFRLPGDDAPYRLAARPPRGERLVLVIWSPEPIFEVDSGALDAPGTFLPLDDRQLDALQAALAPDPETRAFPHRRLALAITRIR